MAFAVTAKGRSKSMSRLDKAIADVAYVLDCMMAYRRIDRRGNQEISGEDLREGIRAWKSYKA